MTTTPLTIFYSWQSDLPSDTNKRGISTCIKQAIVNIEDKNDKIKLILDEATRNETGSPDIPATIFNKISSADIFLCDVSTIDRTTTKRKTPNPNVLIELGYAIAELGWDRIIMVFNKAHGDFPSDLPFDLDKRRVVHFTINDKNDKSGKGDLTSKLVTHISSIAEKKPLKPHQKKGKSDIEVKREKDVASIKYLLSFVHIQSIDHHIESLPYKISDRIFFFKDSFDEIYQSTSFYLYNKETQAIIDKFIVLWRKTLSYYQHFSPSPNKRDYHFHIPFDTFVNEQAEKDFHQLVEDTREFESAFKIMIQHLRQEYLEIDVDEMSKKALDNYVTFEKELLDNLKE